MATDESSNKGVDKTNKGTTYIRGNENTSPEDVHAPEHNSLLHSQHQHLPPDGFAEPPDSNQECRPRSDVASEFWSRGVAKWRALEARSNGNARIGDSTALKKESSNPPPVCDVSESAPTQSEIQTHCSRIPVLPKADGASAISSGVDHLSRPVPSSSATVLDESPDHRSEPLHASLRDHVEVLAPGNARHDQPSELKTQKCCTPFEPHNPSLRDELDAQARDVAGRDQSVVLEAQMRRSPVSASVSIPPTNPGGVNDHDPSTSADAIFLHAGCVESTNTAHLEHVENLQSRLGTENPKSATPTRLSLDNEASSPLSSGSGLFTPKQQQNPETLSKPSPGPKHGGPSSAKATSHLPGSRSVTPITPTRNPRNRHLKTLSAETPTFRPSPPSTTHTPSERRGLGHPRQTSMGTPSIPVESGFLHNSGASSQHFLDPHYPAPHQHTPEGQGQYFDVQQSVSPPLPAHLYTPVPPNMPPFPSPMHSFANNIIHQNAQVYEQGEQNDEYSQSNHFESYAASQAPNAAPNSADLHQSGNLYTQETNGYGPSYYSNHTDPAHHLNQNFYSPLEPHREPSKANQRTARDLFISEDVRLKLHNRTEATLRIFAVMNTPTVEHYHTLTPLTAVTQQQSQTWRGYSSTTYKAVSKQDGRTYCLRRVHGFQATTVNENVIRAVRSKWAAVENSNVVSVHSAFTTTNFEDSSLVIVSDYHPNSRTVAEKHFNQTPGRSNRNAAPPISDQTLWSYVVQITNALKAVHSAQLAVRVFEPTKAIVTDENRIRLNGCALEDLLDSQAHELADLQRLDFHKFGNFILAVGTNNISSSSPRARAPEVFAQSYYKNNPQLRIVVEWLLGHDRPENNEGVDVLVKLVSSNIIDNFDFSLRLNDQLHFSLNKEIENSRIVRLMAKLNCLNERPEYERDRTYSAMGTRAVLGLFRDYVFHQVNAQGNPVVDIGYILACLNKLDAGIEERIALTARDEQSVIVVSYKELKGALEGAWQELMRRSTG